MCADVIKNQILKYHWKNNLIIGDMMPGRASYFNLKNVLTYLKFVLYFIYKITIKGSEYDKQEKYAKTR